MKRKEFFISVFIVLVCITALIISLLKKHDTEIYISNYGKGIYSNLDMVVKIDNDSVFIDTVYNSHRDIRKISYPLSTGFHKISVESKKANLKEEKEIFIFFNERFSIEFYDFNKLIDNKPTFTIETKF